MNTQKKFLAVLIFLLSPVISFVFVTVNYLKTKTFSNPFFLIFVVSIFLGLINSVKVVESDLLFYLKQFEFSSELTYLEYIFFNIKDPIFYSFNYIFYHFISTDFQFYIFLLTVISYCFLLLSIFNFSNWIGLNYKFSFLSLIILALFPQIFSFSAHIIRQFFALSVGFYALSVYFKNDKKKIGIFLLFFSCLIHSSNILLFSIIFLSLTFKKLFKLSFLIIPLIIYIYTRITIDNPLLSGFVRLKNISAGAELDQISLLPILLCILLVFVNLIINSKNNVTPQKIIFDRFFYFFNILFIFFLINNNSELASRLLYVIYFFWPIIFSAFLFKLKSKTSLIFPSLFFFLIIFLVNLFFGIWTYEDLTIIYFPLKNLII